MTTDTPTTLQGSAAHTRGPWSVRDDPPNYEKLIASSGRFIARVYMGEDRDANARLIAAAPKMLATLKETVLQLQYLADKFGETGTGAAVLARVQAVIDEAEGRS